LPEKEKAQAGKPAPKFISISPEGNYDMFSGFILALIYHANHKCAKLLRPRPRSQKVRTFVSYCLHGGTIQFSPR
jgi:hypothetical protein